MVKSRAILMLTFLASQIGCKHQSNHAQVKDFTDSATINGRTEVPMNSYYYWADESRVYRIRCGSLAERFEKERNLLNIETCRNRFASTVTSLDIDSEFKVIALRELNNPAYRELFSHHYRVNTGEEYIKVLEKTIETTAAQLDAEQLRDLKDHLSVVKNRFDVSKNEVEKFPLSSSPETTLKALINQLQRPEEYLVADIQSMTKRDNKTFLDVLLQVFSDRYPDAAKRLKPPAYCGEGVMIVIATRFESESSEVACHRLGYDFVGEIRRFNSPDFKYSIETFIPNEMLKNLMKQTPIVSVPDPAIPSKVWGGGHLIEGKDRFYVLSGLNSENERVSTIDRAKVGKGFKTLSVLCVAPTTGRRWTNDCSVNF